MPIEELLKRYKLQRESATPETDVEESVREGEGESDMECGDSGEEGDQSASEWEEEEEGEGEGKEEVSPNVGDAGLEFLVQSANEVRGIVNTCGLWGDNIVFNIIFKMNGLSWNKMAGHIMYILIVVCVCLTIYLFVRDVLEP